MLCRRNRAHTLMESGEWAVPWKNTMIRALRREIAVWELAHGSRWMPCGLPVEVRAAFFFERELDTPSFATPYPTGKTFGDLDKLDRNLLDALTQSTLIGDDSQVVRIVSEKRWAPESSKGCVQAHVLLAPARGAL